MRVLLLSCLVALGGPALADETSGRGKSDHETTVVDAPIGKIRGNFDKSILGRRFFSARGIRYAEAPVEDLRFRPAIPANNWTKVFDATHEGPACPQPDPKSWLKPSEDCLRLNVYSPALPSSEERVKKPVLVFFPPGAYYQSSGQSLNFGPEYLMDQDIVLVTVNYRLASLGFISTGDCQAPGNLGLKDQVVALRWIKKNIAAFGGDCENVAISGYSAGGWSVYLHMVSPMSKGLFHRAIVMSGSAPAQRPLDGHQIDLTRKQAKLLDCPTDTTKRMIKCLKTKPAKAFADSLPQMFEWNSFPVLLWSAVVEPEVSGVERFLTAQPEDLIRQGKFHKVPLMIGITKDEFVKDVVQWVEESRSGDNSTFGELNYEWERLAPIMFEYERGSSRSKEVSTALKSFYFKDDPICEDTCNGLAQLIADGVIGYSVHRLAKLIAQASCKPVYYFDFTYAGKYSFTVWSDTGKPYGVAHRDNLLYLFSTKAFPAFETADPEYATVEKMTAMWTSFAGTGNPIPKGAKGFDNVEWEAFTPRNNKYLDIGKSLTMNTGLYAERMEQWEKLFPLDPTGTETDAGR